MEILLALTVGALCIGCFIIGAKVGQTASKGETIELPSMNPLEAFRKHEARKEADKEAERIDTIMKNIESYDGTSNNQIDVGR
jgi:hypothetical protein